MKIVVVSVMIMLLIADSILAGGGSVNSWSIYNSGNSGLKNDFITGIAFDKTGNKWFSTSGGLVKFDGQEWTVYDTLNSEIPSNRLTSICVDYYGNIWISTFDNGIAKFDPNNTSDDNKWVSYNRNNSKISADKTWSIVADNEDNVWFCVQNKGVDRIVIHENSHVKSDPKNIRQVSKVDMEWYNYNELNSELKSNYVTNIFVDNSDNKWFTPGGQGLVKYQANKWNRIHKTNSKLPENYVVAFDIDNSGNKWIGTFPGMGFIKVQDTSWYFYNNVTSDIPANGVSSITHDKNGTIWFSAFESDAETFSPYGLVKFDGHNFVTFDKANSSLPTNDITVLKADAEGNIWIGTNGFGIVKLSK